MFILVAEFLIFIHSTSKLTAAIRVRPAAVCSELLIGQNIQKMGGNYEIKIILLTQLFQILGF